MHVYIFAISTSMVQEKDAEEAQESGIKDQGRGNI